MVSKATWIAGTGRRIFRTGLVLLAPLIVLACESSGPIDAEDSIIELRLGPGEWPEITRELTVEPGGIRESWDWPNGGLYVSRTRANTGYRYENDFSDPEDLIDEVRNWSSGQYADVDRRDIYTDRNANGEFQYVILTRGSRRCFYMLQPIPYRPGLQGSPAIFSEISAGLVAAQHCEATAAISPEKFEDYVLRFARALARTW